METKTTKTILIIEDSDDVRGNINEILLLANYNVLCAKNGKEGLESAQKNKPDLILCDVMMPELDGYGVLRGVLNNPKIKNTPFIFVTAKSDKKDFRKGMDLGADDYLSKPFSGDDLLSLVSTRLKKVETLKEGFKNNYQEIEEFFSGNSSVENIYSVSDKLVTQKLRKKDILFFEGDSAKYLYFLISGKVKTFMTNDQGKEYITNIYKTKDFFGYSSLMDDNIYKESAAAMEDSEIASILKQDFHQLLITNKELYTKFIKFITANLSETNNKLIQLAYNSARKRVAEAIIYLAKKYHPEPSDNMSFSVCRDDISSISGVTPESVSRNLTDLRAEKLIEVHNGQINILNYNKLNNLKN